MCSSHQPLDQIDLKWWVMMLHICASLRGWLHKGGGLRWGSIDQGVGRPTIYPVGPSPLVGWVHTWCRVGMCWKFHLGTSVWSLIGHTIHMLWCFTIEKKHTLHPRVENHLEVCHRIMEALEGYCAHRGGRSNPYGDPTSSTSPFCYVL